MADNDAHEDAESTVSTPNSTIGGNSGLKAAKDRSCPFCGQAFTSSSLGRHLDLYIKAKNAKAADGVHDVHEIRKLRGNITRRQPRTSVKHSGDRDRESASRQDSSGWSSNAAHKSSKGGEARMTDDSPVASPVNARDEHVHTWFNAPTWHATGVINDLPARAPSRGHHNATPTGQAQRLQEMRRDTSGNRVERPEYVSDDMWKLQEAAEVGRAAEMALREVLGSLEAAKKKAEPSQLFEDFDFYSLSFPGLCLALLPPPSTLFSSLPFPAAHTCSLSPPDEKQFDTLSRVVNERVALKRNGRPEHFPDSSIFALMVHLQGAFEHWSSMSEDEKSAAWNLEILRAFVREKETKHELKTELENAQRRIRHLEAEYNRLSRCQLPREYLLHPPNTIALSPAIMREMRSTDQHSAATDVNYDADALISKWRAVVKSTARPHKADSTQTSSHPYVENRRNRMNADIAMNGSVFVVNGPLPRDIDMQGNVNEQPAITYETPQQPGAVIDAEDDHAMEADADADGEAEEVPESYRDYTISGPLTRLRGLNRSPYDLTTNGLVNANGKRPLAHASSGGRSGPKMYRERPKD